MTESDRKYYERKSFDDKKRRAASEKAKNRGRAAAKWFKTNKLTIKTKPEFDKLMKESDIEFENRT